ncbi:hypothetical protein V1508DRAFT_461188 [Lipomyces doorenjongii]|uniref:uncharacterized protein n=1 Tax=Lipomyces doorenjongii TaxID=383834 RepID=UPI0034CDB486
MTNYGEQEVHSVVRWRCGYVAYKTVLKDTALGTLGILWLLLVTVPWVSHLPQPSDRPHWFFGHFYPLHNEQLQGNAQLKWFEENPESSFVRYYGIFRSERLALKSHAALQTILQTTSYSFVKPDFARKSLAIVVGDGLLKAEGDSHKRQRKLLMPAFSFGHIKSLTPVFVVIRISIAAINQLKSFWGKDADKFNPDRWNDMSDEALSP